MNTRSSNGFKVQTTGTLRKDCGAEALRALHAPDVPMEVFETWYRVFNEHARLLLIARSAPETRWWKLGDSTDQ